MNPASLIAKGRTVLNDNLESKTASLKISGISCVWTIGKAHQMTTNKLLTREVIVQLSILA